MTALAKVRNGGTMPTLSSWMENWFNNDLHTPLVNSSSWNLPRVNILESDDRFILEVFAPGLDKSDLNVKLDNDLLTISSEVGDQELPDTLRYTRREFGHVAFERTFTIPETVDGNKVSADYKNGVLNISMPKIEDAKRKPVRSISIK